MNKTAPRKRRSISYERKKSLYGYGFIALWLFGLIFYFFRPLSEALRFSLGKIQTYGSGYRVLWQGLSNYQYLLRVDPNYMRAFYSALIDLLYDIPVLIVFVIIIAMILNQRFIGRTAMRAVFFIPVIVASGVIIKIINGDAFAQSIISGGGSMIRANDIENYFFQLGLPNNLIGFVVVAFRSIFQISWRSGLQILIMLAGLQTIPTTLYEASTIDGATGWQKFWLITFPMVSPMLTLIVVYSVIDSFISVDSWLMSLIQDKAIGGQIELGAAMSLMFSVCVLAVVGVVYLVINKLAKKYADM